MSASVSLSAESHTIVMLAAVKRFWRCGDWQTQRMLLAEATRHFRELQRMGVIDRSADKSRRIPR